MKKASYILKSNYIFTSETLSYFKGAVVISGETILDVIKGDTGYEQYIDDQTKVIEYGDKLIMPGFIDAHTHFDQASNTSSPYAIHLHDCKSEEECVQMAVDFRKEHPDIDHIYGFGWLNTEWGDGGAPLPTRHSIDAAIPDIPVYFHSMDGHNFWINSKAIEKCGFTKDSTAPFGGFIKDNDGELTGVIIDLYATTLPVTYGNTFSRDILKEVTADFMKGLSAYGITGLASVAAVTYPGGDFEEYAAYDELNRETEGGLPVRMFLFPCLGTTGDFTIVNRLRATYTAEKVHIAGLKQFVDGVVCGHTAYTQEPYADNGQISKPFFPKETLLKVIKKANAEGYSVRLHTISDGSAHMALDIFEEAQKGADMNKITNTLEHLDNLEPEDIPRFAQLGVIPSMQPAHITLTKTYFEQSMGERRSKLAYQHRNLLDSGATLALGTDAPCVSVNPYETLYYAITRSDFDGNPLTKNPDQAMTLAEALRAYTYGASCAVGASDRLGTLTPGKYADIVVVDGPLFRESPDAIRKHQAETTFSAGRIVYEKA